MVIVDCPRCARTLCNLLIVAYGSLAEQLYMWVAA